MDNECELCWAAGFWDGEGSCWGPRTRVILGIGQSDRDVLDRFAAAVGCGFVAGPYFRNGASATKRDGYERRPMFKWQASSVSDVGRVARLLYPRVSRVKREQLERVLGWGDGLSLAAESQGPPASQMRLEAVL